MPKTVIALMDNIGETQAVVKELVAGGIRREDIGFTANEKHTVPPTAHLNESEGGDAGSAEDLRRGGILVTVAAGTEAQADTAVNVMKRHGALDIDERATGSSRKH